MAILNNSPVLSLIDIIDQLFNNELLADVVFSCDNKMIYAHSFLLMSRSVVYETEFRSNQGVQKLIPIQKYTYETFYEFVRFIYTDECTITRRNVVELLELSVKYKIPKLENMVIAFVLDNELNLNEKFRIYVFCANENYQLLRSWISSFIGPLIPDIIQSDDFLTISPHILETILKMDDMGTETEPVNEAYLFNSLIKWMNHYCKQNNIALSERRIKFDNLIQLIRFPVMVFAELAQCIQQSDDLFTESDYVTFFKPEARKLWNCKPRKFSQNNVENKTANLIAKPQHYYQYHAFDYIHRVVNTPPHAFQTTEKLIITGLRIKSNNITSIQIQNANSSSELLNIPLNATGSETIISFGESYLLQPNSKYLIEMNSSNQSTTTTSTKSNLVDENFAQFYKELVRDDKLIQIFFKMPETS